MLNDDEFRTLLQFLDRPWGGYRKVRKGVKKRVRRHMEQKGCATIEEYLQLLQMYPEAKVECERCLYVTISRFFRDRQLWQVMEEKIFPELTKQFHPSLQIWSAGCACGEEAYTIAMVYNLVKPDTRNELFILATDTQAICLQRAKNGVYPPSSLKEIPAAMLSTYFDTQGGGHQFSILKEKLPSIQWQRHNLTSDRPPDGPFHMIFMRNNLLTYHRGLELETTLHQIKQTLVPGGLFVVGSHERLGSLSQGFIQSEKCPWIYRYRSI